MTFVGMNDVLHVEFLDIIKQWLEHHNSLLAQIHKMLAIGRGGGILRKMISILLENIVGLFALDK